MGGKPRGFTLTELLVVIAVIVILSLMTAATLKPLLRQVQANNQPALRAARQIEAAFQEARRLAMHSGVPHSVVFNRPPPRVTYSGSDVESLFQANWADSAAQPPRGDNFYVIVRHQFRPSAGAPWEGGVVNPWKGWRERFMEFYSIRHGNGDLVSRATQRYGTGTAGLLTDSHWDIFVRNANPGEAAMQEMRAPLGALPLLLEHHGVTTVEAGRLPAGTGFHAFGAGIPGREDMDGAWHRVWRWTWDDQLEMDALDRGMMNLNGGIMAGEGEGIHAWIDAAGLDGDQNDPEPIVTETSNANWSVRSNPDRAHPLFSRYERTVGATPGYLHPHALAARVTFLPSGEAVGYAGGRAAVLPDGPFTPPFNYSLTPDGFHVVAVADTRQIRKPTPSYASSSTTDLDLSRVVDSSFQDDYDSVTGENLGPNLGPYYVGINVITGDTWVYNRYQMLDYAHDRFPCPLTQKLTIAPISAPATNYGLFSKGEYGIIDYATPDSNFDKNVPVNANYALNPNVPRNRCVPVPPVGGGLWSSHPHLRKLLYGEALDGDFLEKVCDWTTFNPVDPEPPSSSPMYLAERNNVINLRGDDGKDALHPLHCLARACQWHAAIRLEPDDYQ